MSRHMLYNINPKYVRDRLWKAREVSMQIHALEKELIQLLYEIDRQKFYVRLGFKSLRSFCLQSLKFGRTQSQRLVTRVRQSECAP